MTFHLLVMIWFILWSRHLINNCTEVQVRFDLYWFSKMLRWDWDQLAIVESNGLSGEQLFIILPRECGGWQVTEASLFLLPIVEDLDVLGCGSVDAEPTHFWAFPRSFPSVNHSGFWGGSAIWENGAMNSIQMARCTVKRLMKRSGLEGASIIRWSA